MKYAFAVLLIAHGIAHLPGFLVLWQIKNLPELPYKTTLFGGILEVGNFGARVAGLLWLLTGLAFVLAGIAVWVKYPAWHPLTFYVAAFSLALTIAGWPEARVGLFVNLALLLILAWRSWDPRIG